jgi:hypothetical protein
MEITAYNSPLELKKNDYIVIGIALALSLIFLVLLLRPVSVSFRRNVHQIAFISEFGTEVKRKLNGSLNWDKIDNGSSIYQGDYVLTGEASTATITLSKSKTSVIIPIQSLIRIETTGNIFSFSVKEGKMEVLLTKNTKIKIKSGLKTYVIWGNKDTKIVFSAGLDGELNVDKVTNKIKIKEADKMFEAFPNEELKIAANSEITRKKIIASSTIPDTTFDALENTLIKKVDHSMWKLEKLKIKK